MPDTRDIRLYLEGLLLQAVRSAIDAGDLPDVAVPGTAIERPKDTAKGDFASTLPLRLARDAHVVVVAVGEGLSLSPVIAGRGGGGEPLAVSNPIWVDVDGGGFAPTFDTMGAYGKRAPAADAEG